MKYDITIKIRVKAKSEKPVERLVDHLETVVTRTASVRLVELEDGSVFSASWEEVTNG